MSYKIIQEKIGSWGKDIVANLDKILLPENSPELNEIQVKGIILATIYTLKDHELYKLFDGVLVNLPDDHKNAVKIAASIMGMNNIYYKFVHMCHDSDFLAMKINLHMSSMKEPGINMLDYELYALAVSVINGCEMCVRAHYNNILKIDPSLGKIKVQSCMRVTSTIHAFAQTKFITEIE